MKKNNEIDARYKLSGSLSPKSLPVLAADILKWTLGHTKIRILDGPGDGRRDILSLTPDGQQHLTQCKHHGDDSKSVSSRETDEIIIALAKFGVKSATFFTNGRISPQAKREYLDNFPGYSLEYIDGDSLLQFVEESPLLARMWLHGSTIGMTTHRLFIPFIVRNVHDDSKTDSKYLQEKGYELYWSSRELFEPYRPTLNSNDSDFFATNIIAEERRISLTELPIAISDMKKTMLDNLKNSLNAVIVRFGKPALMNPRSENKNDLVWVGGLEPESYVISSNSEIHSEREWLLPEMNPDWKYPENISVSEVDWTGWFSESRDAFIMYDLYWPYDGPDDIFVRAEREAVSQSLFVTVSDNNLLPNLQKHEPDWIEQLGDNLVIGWIHPYLLPKNANGNGCIKIENGNCIPTHPDTNKFSLKLTEIRKDIDKMGLSEFDSERAIHLAAALSKPLVNIKTHDRAPSAQIINYYGDIPSPVFMLNREMTYLQMWELDDNSDFDDELFLDSVSSQLPENFYLSIEIKRGGNTNRLFAMIRISTICLDSESATQHANRLIALFEDIKPKLNESIRLNLDSAILATKRFWRDEVGMFFEDEKVIGRPWMMIAPSKENQDQTPKLYIFRPEGFSDDTSQ